MRRNNREDFEIFGCCGHGVAVSEPDGDTIIFANPAFARLVGLDAAGILGRPMQDLLGEGDRQAVARCRAEADVSGESRCDIWLKSPDGRRRLVGLVIGCKRAEQGGLQYRVASLAEKALGLVAAEPVSDTDQYRAFFKLTEDGLFIHDGATGELLEVNEAVPKLYGFGSREEFLAIGPEHSFVDEPAFGPESAMERMRAAVEIGPQRFEWKARRKDGSVFWVEVALRCETFREKKLVLAIVRDIAERRASDEQFDKIFQASPAAGILKRLSDRRIVDVNAAFCRLFGHTREEVIGRLSTELGLWRDEAKREKQLARLLALGRLVGETVELKHRDGVPMLVEASMDIVEVGGERMALSLLEDVTEKTRADRLVRLQQQLAQDLAAATSLEWGLEQCLRVALEAAGGDAGGFYLLKQKEQKFHLEAHVGLSAGFVGKVQDITLGSPKGELVAAGQTLQLDHAELTKIGDRPEVGEGLQALCVVPMHGGGRVSGCLNVAARRKRTFSREDIIAVETVAAGAALAVERLRMEEELKGEHQRLVSTVEGTRAGTWEWNVQTGETVFNEEWARMLGYSLSELAPTTLETWKRLAHPEDIRRSEVLLKKHFAGETPFYECEARLRHRDGHWVWVLDRGRLISSTVDGRPLILAGAHVEISSLKQAEEALRARDMEFRALFETVPVGMAQTEPLSARFVAANRKMCEITGYPLSELLKLKVSDLTHPEDHQRDGELFRRVVSRELDHYRIEKRYVRKTGEIIWVNVNMAVIRDSEGRPLRTVAAIEDITSRRRAADEIQRQAAQITALIRSLPDLVFFKDLDGAYLGCNPAFAAFVGRPEKEIVGHTDQELFAPAVAEEFRSHDRRVLQSLQVQRNEEWIVYSDGRRAMVETQKAPLRAADGRLLGLLGISRDITERIQEAMVQQARNRLLEFAPRHTLEELLVATLDEAEMLSGSRIGFYHFLEADQCTIALQAWSTRTTREMCRAEGKGRHYDVDMAGVWVDCIRERRPVIHNDYAALRHRKGLPPGHAPILREMVVPVMRDGNIVSLLGVGNKPEPYTEQDLALVARLADFAWDLVERRRAEIALSDNAARLRLALVAANQGLYDINFETGEAKVSPEYALMLGYQPEGFRESLAGWRERLHPDDLERSKMALQACMAGETKEYRSEFRLRTKTGGWKWILSIGSIVERAAGGGALRMLGTHTDVSEAKVAEEARRLSEERHRHLIEVSFDWVWEIDTQGTYTYASERVRDILGYDPSEVVGRTIFDLMPEAEQQRMRPIFENLVARPGPIITRENINLHKEGREVSVESNGVPVVRADGTLAGFRGMDRDITARRTAERTLRLHSAALEAAANAVVITDTVGRIEWANRAFTVQSGWQLSEAVGRNPRDLLKSGQHEPEFYRQMWSTILAGRVWHGEMINRRKDGKLRTEDVTITPIFNEQGVLAHFIAVKQDITEKKELEQQARQTQRIEAVGALAGGIAHDLNNILTPMLMVSEMLKEGKLTDTEREMVTIVENGAKRGAAIIRQLLTFSRGSSGERVPVQPRHLMKEMMSIMRETFPREIELGSRLPAELPLIVADPTQIHQVLLNLCVNARDAMPNGGHLLLSASPTNLEAGDARLRDGMSPGHYLEISVRDTGHGIPLEIRDRIFDPFFTTKPLGKGTGLGLATVIGIVRGYGGTITLESEVDRGTTFRVYLPAQPMEPEPVAPAGGPRKPAKGQTILLVDDERNIRETARLVLEHAGYRVLTAVHGLDALQVFDGNADAIQLVLTDIMMPTMNGVALVKELRHRSESLPIIAASGLADHDHGLELAAHGVENILRKPWTTEELLRVVQELMPASRAHDPT